MTLHLLSFVLGLVVGYWLAKSGLLRGLLRG